MTTPEQRRASLAKADAARMAIARLRRELRDGEVTLEAALVDPAFAKKLVWDVLGFQRRWGDNRIERTGLHELLERRCGTLSEAERHQVLAAAAETPLTPRVTGIGTPASAPTRTETAGEQPCSRCQVTRTANPDGVCNLCAREAERAA